MGGVTSGMSKNAEHTTREEDGSIAKDEQLQNYKM